MNTKRTLVAAFAVAIVVVGALSASTVLANAEYDPQNGEKWHSDFGSAQETAQATDTPMLVYFWSADCSSCEKFRGDLQSNAALQDAMDPYVLVSAEFVAAPELRDRYDVSGTPTVVVLTPEGEMVTSFVPTGVDDPVSRLETAHETAGQ